MNFLMKSLAAVAVVAGSLSAVPALAHSHSTTDPLTGAVEVRMNVAHDDLDLTKEGDVTKLRERYDAAIRQGCRIAHREMSSTEQARGARQCYLDHRDSQEGMVAQRVEAARQQG